MKVARYVDLFAGGATLLFTVAFVAFNYALFTFLVAPLLDWLFGNGARLQIGLCDRRGVLRFVLVDGASGVVGAWAAGAAPGDSWAGSDVLAAIALTRSLLIWASPSGRRYIAENPRTASGQIF